MELLAVLLTPFPLPALVPLFILGFPLLLALWAIWYLRAARPTGGLGRAYLLANYGAAVQLSNLRGEHALMVLRFIILFQCVHLYVALQALIFWRSVPTGVVVGGIVLAGGLVYRYIGPTVDRRFRAWHTAAALETYPAAQRRAWGLLGHASFAGSSMLVFIIAILREYLS